MSKRIDLDLSNIAEGGLQEKVDMEMGKAFENIHDLNTKATAKRKLTITLELEPDENREVVKVNSTVKSNLAPLTDVSTTILTGINASGEVEANELRSGVKGQTFFGGGFLEPNNENIEIGTRIKAIRINLGLTMEEFGNKFDPVANKSLVSKWESGKSLPNNERLKRISELGNVTMTYLLEGKIMLGDIHMMPKEEQEKLWNYLECWIIKDVVKR